MTIHLIKGDDPTLVGQALSSLLDTLVAGGDRTLMVEELTESDHVGESGGQADMTSLLTAAATPPFLTERRVVIGRHCAVFSKAEQVKGLVDWLRAPTETTDLVLVWEKGPNGQRTSPVPKSLKDALKTAGVVELDAAPKGKGRAKLLEHRLNESPVRFDAASKSMVADHFGDDVGRASALVEILVSTYGEGAAISPAELEGYLGSASDVPPWELTDALDSGDITTALDKLKRMTQGGERHALQVLATLHGHYQRVLGLDGSSARNERDAADVLGMKGSTFPAKKALNLSRKLGPERTRSAMLLVADADLAVRGGSGMEPEGVLEVLIARLARLSR